MELVDMLRMQRELQIKMKEANPTQGGDPLTMTPDELATFITWNHTALIKELGEAMDEVGWKPWASSRHVNYTAAVREMVDAWHFFMNIMLALLGWARANAGDTDKEAFTISTEDFQQVLTVPGLAKFFEEYYREKNAKNLQRQVEGYDGVVDKCPQCKRDRSEAMNLTGDIQIQGYACPCGYVWH